jgi:hypothetical protein
MKRAPTERAACWGVFREREHSPGREADDAAILTAAGRRLESAGSEWVVAYRAPGELTGRESTLPALAFAMCEGRGALEHLAQWERRGVCVVNSPRAIAATHRETAIPLLEAARVPVPETLVLDCAGTLPAGQEPLDSLFAACWIKQATEHKTREGDVAFAADATGVREALDKLRARQLPRAVVQRHVEGDLVKFYGVSSPTAASAGTPPAPSWFQWFHPKEKPAAGHPFDEGSLRDIACRAAGALGLEVWGGDAIVTAGGEILVIDVNAWPSFALYRDEAADRIAAHLASRLRRLARVAV